MFTLFYVAHQGFHEQHGFFYLDLVHMRIVHQRHPPWHVIKTLAYLSKDPIYGFYGISLLLGKDFARPSSVSYSQLLFSSPAFIRN